VYQICPSHHLKEKRGRQLLSLPTAATVFLNVKVCFLHSNDASTVSEFEAKKVETRLQTAFQATTMASVNGKTVTPSASVTNLPIFALNAVWEFSSNIARMFCNCPWENKILCP
jgi:hypothetical protein